MYARVRGIVIVFGLLLILSGCSLPGSCTSRPANATPDTGTFTTDPVSIATDKSVYAPSDVVHVTFTDHLSTPIQVTAKRAACPLVTMEQLDGSVWQDFSVCGPPPVGNDQPINPRSVYLLPGNSSGDELTKGNAQEHPEHPDFPTGTFRLVLHYTQYGSPSAVRGVFTEYSATFRICSCGVCK